jgi:triosephosphate isomerase
MVLKKNKTKKITQQNEKKIVAGNWKMHKNAEQTEDLLNELIAKNTNGY